MKRKLLQYSMLLLATSFFSNYALAQCSTSSTPTNNCTWGDNIDKVTLNGVSTTSGSSNGCSSSGYGSFSAPVFSMTPGVQNSFTALLGGGFYTESFAIYIDLNNNGVFDNTNELVYSYNNYASTLNGTFTIPANTPGLVTGTPLKIRFRCSYLYSSWSLSDACVNSIGSYGETEDYTVIFCNPLSISSQPVPAMDCEGSSVDFEVTPSTTDVNYQWQVDNGSGYSNITNGASASGATSKKLTLNNVSGSMNGNHYRCILTSTCNTSIKDTSNSSTLNVIANAKVNSQSPPIVTCENVKTKVGVKGSGVITGYQWQILPKGGSGFTDITASTTYSGVTSDSLNINGIPASLDGAVVRCILKGQCKADTTDSISIEVQPLPKVVKDPANVSVIHGGDALFVVEAQGLNLNYRWQAGYNGKYSFINNNAIYKGVNNDSLIVSKVSEAQNGFTYRCIISGQGNCAADPDTSTVAVMNVLPPLGISNTTTENGIQLYPNPVSGNEVTISVNNNEKDLNYKIMNTVGSVVAQGQLPNTSNHKHTIAINELSSGIYTFYVVNKNGNKVASTQFSKL